MSLRLLNHPFTALAAALLVLNACAFKKEDSSEKKEKDKGNTYNYFEKQPQPNDEPFADDGTPLKEEDFKINLVGQPEPNSYKVIIEWKKKSDRVEIMRNDQSIASIKDRDENFFELNVKSGENVSLSIAAYDDQRNSNVHLNYLKFVPYDHVIYERPLNIRENTKLTGNRVFIKDDSIIKIGSNSLEIADPVKELIVGKNVKIVTFDENEDVPYGQTKHGGTVIINTERMSGTLNVELRGAKGKKGPNGTDLTPMDPQDSRIRGAEGKTARYRDYTVTFARHTNDPVLGGWPPTCERPPTDGEPGRDGQPGNPGGNGESGGASGKISVNVKEKAGFNVNILQKAGKFGDRGRGGLGGTGGAGGKSGSYKFVYVHGPDGRDFSFEVPPNRQCPAAKNGPNGKQGPRGADGLQGNPGVIEAVICPADFCKVNVQI